MTEEDEATIGEQLAGWGKVVLLETRGRVSGRPMRAAVGFVEDPDGSLLIAAGTEQADWVLNLRRQPSCTLAIGEHRRDYVAEEISGSDRAQALTGLILKYGTPAERLGHGPVFRLVLQR
jgi:deazaflavin-dependent oxidoreductase (nitroreductase family)